jgi:hypothetical protein
VQSGLDLILIDIVDSLFLGGSIVVLLDGGSVDLGSVGLAVSAQNVLVSNVAFVEHEAEHFVIEESVDVSSVVGSIGEGLLGAVEVAGQLFLEQLQGILVVSLQVVVGTSSALLEMAEI